MKHYLSVAAIVIGLTILVGVGLTQTGMLPRQASLQAEPIDTLFQFHFWAIAFLFALIVGFMIYSIIVFRRQPGDEEDAAHMTGHTGLEVIWTLIPLGVVLFVAFWGADILAEIRRTDPEALQVNVIGTQWNWQFEYPDYNVTSSELRLPVDKQALLTLSSLDVIHSFWVPEFRVKQDALPGEGMERELHVTPTEIGEYTARCAEVCGRDHAYMTAPVIVMEQGEFEAWIEGKAAEEPQDPVALGKRVSQEMGCQSCHSLDGSEGSGPTWLNIMGIERTLTDGTTVTVDEEYLYQSIMEPQEKIVAGYEDVTMPHMGQMLNEEEIQAIIAFIKSLSE